MSSSLDKKQRALFSIVAVVVVEEVQTCLGIYEASLSHRAYLAGGPGNELFGGGQVWISGK